MPSNARNETVKPEQDAPAAAAPVDHAALEKMARNHIAASLGVGLVPVPLADIVGLVAIQLDMIKKIADAYGVSFSSERGKAILTSLLAGCTPVAIGGTVISLLKFVPLIGHTSAAVAMPVLSGASTYAVYKVFVGHFETGGTLLDLDAAKMKQAFSDHFCAGKKVAADLAKDQPAAA